MAISRASDSSIQGGLPKFNDIWDGRSAVGAMDALGVVLLASATADITFNNIPQTYTHLQIRTIVRGTTSGSDAWYNVNFNSDTTTSNYNMHYLLGNGTSASSAYLSGADGNIFGRAMGSASGADNNFAPNIHDILDYTNTNKNKVTRSFSGQDNNNTRNLIMLSSSLWRNTAAISTIRLIATSGNFSQNSLFALYGVK